jgi:hypothetical protein
MDLGGPPKADVFDATVYYLIEFTDFVVGIKTYTITFIV